MKFGEAIEAAKEGKRIQREGWNGKGMWVAYTPMHVLTSDKFVSGANKEYAVANGGDAIVKPYLTMRCADREILVGWLASQSDMLSEDWVTV